jgi:AcrR family transcriptional regulator
MSTESSQKRPYRLKQRAEAQERTRTRIAAAAMELHGTLGPARTSISAVAERAGVQRTTVYRHFPDEAALFAACSAHWAALHPPPDPSMLPGIADPDERLRTGLSALYAWYREGEAMLTNVIRDEPHVPALRDQVAGLRGYLTATAEMMLPGRGLRGHRRRRVAASIGHATEFEVWRSLAGRGLGDEEIVELMVRLAAVAGG